MYCSSISVGNSSSLDPAIAQEANAGLQKVRSQITKVSHREVCILIPLLQCTDLLEHLSETCSTASQHRQILLDITRLSSTKLRSRDDAENLLSSRVPAQPSAASSKATSVEPSGKVSEMHATHDTSSTLNTQQNSNSNIIAQPSNLPPTTQAQNAQAVAPVQNTLLPASIVQSSMPPTFTYPQAPAQIDGIASYNNPFLNTQQQPSSFLNDSDTFTSGFDFGNNGMLMPFSLNPSTNQADLAFWREMPIGEDASEWGFFTDQYANTLLSSLPTFTDTYTSQM